MLIHWREASRAVGCRRGEILDVEFIMLHKKISRTAGGNKWMMNDISALQKLVDGKNAQKINDSFCKRWHLYALDT